CEEAGFYYNRLVFIHPNGSILHYDKRHLFRMADEDHYFKAGEEKLIVNYKGWKILPLVCYDLRFPIWSRNVFETDRKTYVKSSYDVLIYIANWPKARVGAWDKLLQARAIENQAYVIGVNRVGADGNDILYSGNSAVIDPKGEYILEPIIDDENSTSTELDYQELANFREKFPVGMDADNFELL
ncbi:nitrilase family protein, partial [Vicingaceae bacterium]|nr:nitrilase family protein [Vicingaceae bacterium]